MDTAGYIAIATATEMETAMLVISTSTVTNTYTQSKTLIATRKLLGPRQSGSLCEPVHFVA